MLNPPRQIIVYIIPHSRLVTVIRAGRVQQGFTEAEVRLALGEPSDVTAVRNGQYQWVYQHLDTGRPFRSVTFNARTKRVRNATR